MNTNKTSLVFTTSIVTPAFRRVLKNTASVHVARLVKGSSCMEVICYHPLFGWQPKGSSLVHWEVGCFYCKHLKAWFYLARRYNEATNTVDLELESPLTVMGANYIVRRVRAFGIIPCGIIPVM